MAQFISVKKEQQTNKHALFAFMLCLLLLFSSFFSITSVFAESSIPFTSVTTSYGSFDSDSLVWTIPSGGSTNQSITFSNIDYITFGNPLEFTANFSSLLSSASNINFLFVANGTNNNSYNSFKINGSPSYSSFDVTTDDYNFSFTNTNSSYTDVGFRLTFSNISSGSIDFSEFFSSFTNSGGEIINNGNAIIVVNPGNVAYIGYDSATFNFLINLSKPVSSLNSNARYGFASELPSGVITFTPSSGNALPLRKSVPDLLGRSATWVGSVDTDTVGYFIVYNPVYDLNGNTNPPIRVTVTVGYMNVTQFPLTASDIGGDIISTGNSDNFYISDGMQGGTDLPSYIYSNTDQNGNVTTSSALTVPVTPYNYTEPSASNSESGLQGFLQSILDLLSAPIKLIQNLYDGAVSFFNYLSSLWSWLPSELTTIIVSALGVLVVIGVVKFLWK